MKNQNLPSTQDHLMVKEIKDNLLIHSEGTISLVLQTSSVNFELLSEGEQDAKILAFGQLLNSLTHPAQILIRTRKVNILNYLDYIRSFQKKQLSPGLKRQITIYLQFVQNLIIKNEVLDKSFYIIIPFKGAMIQNVNPLLKFKASKNSNAETGLKSLDQAKSYLYPKRDHVMKQLIRMGLQSHQLSSQELLELFHDCYNPPPMESINEEDEEV